MQKKKELKREKKPFVKLSIKEYGRYQRQRFEKLVVEKKNKWEIIEALGITDKIYHKWRQRMARNGTTDVKQKGI